MKNKRIVIIGMCFNPLQLQHILKEKREIITLPITEIETVVPKQKPLVDSYKEILIESIKEVSDRNVIPKNFYSKHNRKREL